MRNQGGNSAFSDDLRSGLASDTVRRLPAANPEQIFFHFDFVRSLQMHRRMAVGIFVIAAVLSLGYMAMRWNTYKGESLVYVQPSPHRIMETGPVQQWDANTYESYIQQQVHDVTRPDVLAAAVKRLPGWRGAGESEQAAADRLGSNVEVTRVGTAYEVSIVATAGSADQAARMANALAASFIDSAARQERSGDPERIDLLRDERDRILKELATDRAEQDDLSRKLGVAAVTGNAPDPIDEQIAQTRAELVKAKTDNDEAAAKLTALAGGKASNAALEAEADALVSADPGLVSMKTSLNARRSLLISQMANLTPNHPQYKQDAEELAKINTSLDEMTRELRTKSAAQIEQRLKNDLERTSSVEARLNGQLAALTGAAGSAAPWLQRTNELTADIQRLQSRFSVVDEQYRDLTMENNAPGAVYLASAALPPLHAARSKVFRNGFIVLLAALVFALGGALVAHNFDPKVYIATDVERVLGIAPMAQVPDLLEVGSGVAEEYMLRLAAAVEHAHQQGLLSSCIFTGVAPGAGATTVSKRVSGLLEAMGRETVLVDAVGAPPRGGSNLKAGTGMVHAPRGSRSTALLHQMAEDTDEDTVVVTDTAPLLVSGETEYLARFVDSAIVVIESGVTTKAELREVSKTLQRLDVASVGFVLNRIALENANPAFRRSLRAVEAHLRSQARAFERAGATSEKEQPAPAPLSMEQLCGVVASQSATVAAKEPEPFPPGEARRETAHTVQQQPVAAPVSTEAAAKASPMQPAEPERQGMPEDAPAAAIPTETADPGQPPAAAKMPVQQQAPTAPGPALQQPAQTTMPVQPEAAAMPVQQQAAQATAPATTGAREPAQGFIARPLRGREPARTASVAVPRTVPAPPVVQAPVPRNEPLAEPKRSPVAEDPASSGGDVPAAEVVRRRSAAWADLHEPTEAPAIHHPQPTAPELARPPAAPDLAATPAVPSTALTVMATAESPADDLPYSTASRLGGLRSLMTSLGIQNLHKETEHRKAGLDADSAPERQGERAVFAQAMSPPEPANGHPSAQSAEVMAHPEIIPPRMASEVAERERERDREREKEREAARNVKPPRVSRWDTVDDVETLPSRRGQYRKRH